MSALINQKPFTFMKDATVFEDPKTNKPWASADAIRKKAWVPTLRKAESVTVILIKLDIHLLQNTLVKVLICFG